MTEVLHTPSSTQPGFELITPNHNSTFHVTETPALTIQLPVTFKITSFCICNGIQLFLQNHL